MAITRYSTLNTDKGRSESTLILFSGFSIISLPVLTHGSASQSLLMTTLESISLLKPVTYAEISSCEAEDWQHPMLEMFRPIVEEHEKQKARLYLIPSTFDDEFDPDFSPQPTSASDLPELHEWTMRFVVSVLEIWAGRRSPSQLTRMCHRKIFTELHARAGTMKEVGKLRTIHQSEPLDGICESVVTVRYGERLRALSVRFEGVDNRWLCTALDLL
jgi:hypothetical protein